MVEFKRKYMDPLKNFETPDGPSPKNKIRIAIIDTGVRAEDPLIITAREEETIRICRNFATPEHDEWEDEVENGHGTLVARLLLEVAPEAELYIAKVSREKTIPKKELYRIAQVGEIELHVLLQSLCQSKTADY